MFLSIMGMYEYDQSLFDGLDVPTYTDPNNVTHIINKEKTIDNICLKCTEMEVIYPEFDTMKLAIAVWSAANQETWSKLYATQMIEYNPIWNVDADIKIGRTRNAHGENKGAVQGFNSTTWADANKDNSTFNEGESITEHRTGNIGVTASQDLIKKEREIADFNVMDFIAESFKKRFCLMVY